ncbi:hypothetical protein [Gayadomonas joobiniege]|uniref:hypothetical protein n=1 Tax=Gayadomonas joobiniege TaxID=1234606 RepID=UPI00035E25D4|nr:hypothetical protein [Gayadomonas joobiniege]
MSQEATIKTLILAAAEGASEGVGELQQADIPVELEEFEIKVTYAAETSIETKTSGSLSAGLNLKFLTVKSKVGHTRSTRQKATYGLEVRFLFSGKEIEGDAA